MIAYMQLTGCRTGMESPVKAGAFGVCRTCNKWPEQLMHAGFATDSPCCFSSFFI